MFRIASLRTSAAGNRPGHLHGSMGCIARSTGRSYDLQLLVAVSPTPGLTAKAPAQTVVHMAWSHGLPTSPASISPDAVSAVNALHPCITTKLTHRAHA